MYTYVKNLGGNYFVDFDLEIKKVHSINMREIELNGI